MFPVTSISLFKYIMFFCWSSQPIKTDSTLFELNWFLSSLKENSLKTKEWFASSQPFQFLLVWLQLFFLVFSTKKSKKQREAFKPRVLFIAKFKAKLASIRWMNDHLRIICRVRCRYLAQIIRQHRGNSHQSFETEVSSFQFPVSPRWGFFFCSEIQGMV